MKRLMKFQSSLYVFILFLSNGLSAAEAESGRWAVTLKKAEACSDCRGGTTHIFETKEKEGSLLSEIRISNTTAAVKDINIYGDKLVVFGGIPASGTAITIVNLNTGEVLDHFLAYREIVSPSLRYILYRKWYPRFSRAEQSGLSVVIYDVETLPMENPFTTLDIGRNEHSSHALTVYDLNGVDAYDGNSKGALFDHTIIWRRNQRGPIFVVESMDDLLEIISVEIMDGNVARCSLPILPKRLFRFRQSDKEEVGTYYPSTIKFMDNEDKVLVGFSGPENIRLDSMILLRSLCRNSMQLSNRSDLIDLIR